MTTKNGVRGYIKENPIYANTGNTLSFAQDTFSVFYQKEKYFTGNKVKILKPKFEKVSANIMSFISACFQKSLEKMTWGIGSTVETILKTKICLPIIDKKINFEFMETFVAELEKQRVAELEEQRVAELKAYLKVTGLKDYELTEEENNVLREYNNIEFKIY